MTNNPSHNIRDFQILRDVYYFNHIIKNFRNFDDFSYIQKSIEALLYKDYRLFSWITESGKSIFDSLFDSLPVFIDRIFRQSNRSSPRSHPASDPYCGRTCPS